MSFVTLKNDRLREFAAHCGVEVPDGAQKKQIIELLKEGENGVPFTWADYLVFAEEDNGDSAIGGPVDGANINTEPVVEADTVVVVDEAEPVATPQDAGSNDLVLLVSERQNPSFTVLGITFTKTHPYVAADDATASFIVKNYDGIRYATREEVTEYYL